MTDDYKEANKRLEEYGRIYQDFTWRSSLYQTAGIVLAMLVTDIKFMPIIYMIISTFQYMLGAKLYGDRFEFCSNYMEEGGTSPRIINNDGLNGYINIYYFIKSAIWVWIMMHTVYILIVDL